MLGKAIQPEIEELIAAGQFDELRDILANNLEAADIAEILDEVNDEDRALLFRLLPTQLASDVFSLLEIEGQEKLIQSLSREQVTHILNEMSPDDRTRLLEEVPDEVAQRLLRALNPKELAVARTLLGYPEESIGRRMTPEYVAANPNWTVRQTLDFIRREAPRVETINVLYVLDDQGRLVDDLRLGELLLADPDATIRDICDFQFVSLSAFEDQEEAVEAFKKYDRLALPVVGSKGVMVGIVTVDDVLDLAEEEGTEDVQKFGGQEALEDSYFATTVLQLARKRGLWLTVLLVSSFLTVTAMNHFSYLTVLMPVLTVFIPMIISSGGNSGSQSAALIIRGLAVREIELANWWRVFLRELAAGLLLGLFLGVIAGGFSVALRDRAAVQSGEPAEAAVGGAAEENRLGLPLLVLLSVTGVVTIGTLVGSMLPFFFKRIGLDPAVCSGPFIATFVDVSGIVLFFTLFRWIFGGYL